MGIGHSDRLHKCGDVGGEHLGRVDAGRLIRLPGSAQIDRYANLNTTVVGPYDKPKVRLPGGGGAPEIATSCGQVFIVMPQTQRTFVERLDFVTTLGHGQGGGDRARLGITTKGPTKVITDLCVMEPVDATMEMVVTQMHPGVTRQQVCDATGWPVVFATRVEQTAPPSALELDALRELHRRTAVARAAADIRAAAVVAQS